MESRACNRCGEIKELTKFPKFLQRDGKTHGWRKTCKSCMNDKYNKPRSKKQKKLENSPEKIIESKNIPEFVQDKLEFTEEEIFHLKAFINRYEQHVEKMSNIENRKKKKFVSLELDIPIVKILEEHSNNTGIDKSSIVNAFLIKEFIDIKK